MLLGGRVYSVEAIDKRLNDHATDGEKEVDKLYEVDLEIVTVSSSEFWFGDGFHIYILTQHFSLCMSTYEVRSRLS
jgi:hypothetical protein